MRKTLLVSCGLVAAMALFGAGYLVHGLTDGGNDLSLTGSEAAARVERALRQSDPSLLDTVSVAISCDVETFNTDSSMYSVRCLVDNQSGFQATEHWSVNAKTGEAAPNPPVADSA